MRNTLLYLPTRFLSVLLVLFLAIVSASAAGPKFQVIHQFAGSPNDGAAPVFNLVPDQHGNLFGTTVSGGADSTGCTPYGCGTAFELVPRNGRWIENSFYSFSLLSNGAYPDPSGPVVLDSIGNVYGTRSSGDDGSCNCGEVYQLTRSGGVWTENILHTFTGGTSDGAYSYWGLVRDAAGNLYGATESGGINQAGVVFALTPNADGTWTYSVIYKFGSSGSSDASGPYGPLTIDSSGAIYGTTAGGGIFGYGTAFKLSQAAGVWTETVLFNFTLDYGSPPTPVGVVSDAAGNLYGTTIQGGAYGVGTIYKLTPSIGFWNRTVLHTFTGSGDGAYPYGGLAIDASGVLYGTADAGGSFGYGNVYKLQSLNGRWRETVLHEFSKGSDGANPFSAITLDHQGNIFGVTGNGGAYGFGVAFEITP